jgi:hypothetical protein
MNYVAVLCYTKEAFDQWCKEMEIKDREKRYHVKYICINRMKDAEGRFFVNIVRLTGWWKIENADKVEKYVDNHLLK